MCEIYTYDSKHHQKVMEVTVTYTTTKSFLLSYLAINTQVGVRTAERPAVRMPAHPMQKHSPLQNRD